MRNQEPIGIFIPSLNRSHLLNNLVENIHENTAEPHKLYFVVSENDTASQSILDKLGEQYWTDSGEMTFIKRVQFLYEQTSEPWFVPGSDDLFFHKDWLKTAYSQIGFQHCVAVFNDLYNPHGTTCMIRREYIDELGGVIDMPPGTVFCPFYKHNYADTELFCTAIQRGVFLYMEDSIVEHLHWQVGKSVFDETYKAAQNMWNHDEGLFQSRQHLWNGATN